MSINFKEIVETTMDEEIKTPSTMDAETVELLMEDRIATGG